MTAHFFFAPKGLCQTINDAKEEKQVKMMKLFYPVLIYAVLICGLSNFCYADEYPKTWYSIKIDGSWQSDENTIGALVSWKVKMHYSSGPGRTNISPLKDCDCNIYRNGTLIDTVKVIAETTYYIDTSAKAGEINTYTVVANGLKGADGSSVSGTSSFKSLRSVEMKNISKTKLEFNSETESESVEIIGIDYQYDQIENRVISLSLICSWICPVWITVERYGYEYRIKVNSNETGVNRSGSVYFVIGSNNYLIATVNIEQKAKGIDLFPNVSNAQNVAQVLSGLADAKLVANITTVAEYAAYRDWALGLEGVTPQQVKDSPNAWLSYALDTDALIAAAPKEGDVVIDTFESVATDGAFEFTVRVDGVEVGDDALEANIRKVFDIEGAEKLDMGDERWDMSNVEVSAAAPENGKVKFTVAPKGGGEKPNSFFFRVKMK